MGRTIRKFSMQIQTTSVQIGLCVLLDLRYFPKFSFQCSNAHTGIGHSTRAFSLNAQMGIGHSTRASRFRMLRWDVGILLEHSDFECSDGHSAFHFGIQISNAQLGIRHSTGAFRFQMLRWTSGIQSVHSNFDC